MYNERIEALIRVAIADGKLTDKEKQILFRKAEAMGIDLDEFEMVLEGRLAEVQKAEAQQKHQRQVELEKAKAAVLANTPAPKSNKMGHVRKCPACGAIVNNFLASCPECGLEFVGVRASSAAQALFEQLKEVDEKNGFFQSYRKKITVITNFPIPNTKEDLLEIIVSLEPKARNYTMTQKDLCIAYLRKYEVCINKAKLLFPDDPLLLPYIKGVKKVRLIHQLKIWKPAIIFWGGLGLLMLICLLGQMAQKHGLI